MARMTTYAAALLGLLCLVNLCNGAPFSSPSASPVNGGVANFAVSIPYALINKLLLSAEEPIEAAINNITLPTCCYDDVGVKHVHLNLQNLAISNTKVSFALTHNASAADALFAANVGFTFGGFYRLCLHDDPFSPHGCSTLDKCKGNFAISPTAVAGVRVTPSVTNGLLAINGGLQSFSLPSLSNNFCSWFQDAINKEKGKIEEAISKALGEAVTDLLGKVNEDVNKGFNTTTARVAWQFAQGTGNQPTGIDVLMHVDVADAAGRAGPATQKTQPPVAELDTSSVHVAIGDSLVTNSLAALISDGKLDFDFNVTVGNNTIPVMIDVDEVTSLTLDPATGFGIVLSAHTAVDKVTLDIKLDLDMNVTISQNVTAKTYTFHPRAGSLTAQVANCSGSVSECTVAKAIAGLLNAQGAKLINEAFAKLDLEVHLPSVSSLTLQVLSSYFDVAVGFDVAAAMLEVQDYVRNHVGGFLSDSSAVSAIQCPNIPGAHQDSCV